jgi:CheY-like chemotaxis protein
VNRSNTRRREAPPRTRRRAPIAAGDAPEPPAGAARSLRVVLIEDNADAAESLVMLLGLLGHQARSYPDGVSGLDGARAMPPDVMLVDIGLPGIDGYEVARRARRDPRLAAVPLVALTGYGRDEDRHQALAAGFDQHLVKPVDVDALQALLAALGEAVREGAPTLH